MRSLKSNIGRLLGLAVIVILLIYAGPAAFEKMLNASLWAVTLAFLLTAAVYLVAAYRWQLILSRLLPLNLMPFSQYMHYTVMGATVGLVTPSRDLGEIGARIASVKFEYGDISLKKVAFSVLLDRFFDVFVLAPLVVTSIPFLFGYVSGLQAYLVLNGCVTLVILLGLGYEPSYRLGIQASLYVHRIINPYWHKIPLVRRVSLPSGETLNTLPNQLSASTVQFAFLLTLLKYIALAFRAYLVAYAMHLSISMYSFLVSMPVVQSSLILAFTPGALGINELGWYGTLTLLGISDSLILPFLIGFRAFGYLFVLLLALIGQVSYMVVGFGKKNAAHLS